MLLDIVESGIVDPSRFLTNKESFISVIEAYKEFDKRKPGWIKVELREMTDELAGELAPGANHLEWLKSFRDIKIVSPTHFEGVNVDVTVNTPLYMIGGGADFSRILSLPTERDQLHKSESVDGIQARIQTACSPQRYRTYR
jgi:hypothetical protein